MLRLLILIFIACPATFAGAAEENAAVIYRQAFAAMPAKDHPLVKLGVDWRTAPVDAGAVASLKDFDAALGLVHKAGAIKHCDWEVDYSVGTVNIKVPQMMQARWLRQAVCFAIRQNCEQKQYERAVDLAIDQMLLERRVADCKWILARIAGSADELMVAKALAVYLPNMPAKVLERLAGSVAALPELPAFADALRNEGALSEISIRGVFKNANAAPRQLVDQQVAALLSTYEDRAKEVGAPVAQWPAVAAKAKKAYDAATPFVRTLALSDKPILSECRFHVQCAEFRAAIAIAQGGDQVKKFPDPMNGTPFTIVKTASGFSLVSALIQDGQPVKFDVGPQ